MNVLRIIFNKLILPLIPILLTVLVGLIFAADTQKIWINRWSLWIILGLGLLLFFTNNLYGHIKIYLVRKKKFNNPELNASFSELTLPRRVNSLDKKLSINEKVIDILINNNVIVHISKENQEIEIIKKLGKKLIKFNTISYLIMDNNVYERDTWLETFFYSRTGPLFQKSSLTNTFSAILKSGKEVTIFESELFEKSYVKHEDFELSKNNLEITCYENGKKVINILSDFMDKKFMILDNKI